MAQSSIHAFTKDYVSQAVVHLNWPYPNVLHVLVQIQDYSVVGKYDFITMKRVL
jgi:hypothetical protein